MFRDEKNPLYSFGLLAVVSLGDSFFTTTSSSFFKLSCAVHFFGFTRFFSMFRSRSFDFCFYFTTSLTTISFCAHGYSICWPVCCMRLLLPKYSNVFELLTEQSYSVYHTFNFMYDVFFFFIHSTRYWRRKRKRDEHSKCEKANENSNNTNNNITVFFLKNQL